MSSKKNELAVIPAHSLTAERHDPKMLRKSLDFNGNLTVFRTLPFTVAAKARNGRKTETVVKMIVVKRRQRVTRELNDGSHKVVDRVQYAAVQSTEYGEFQPMVDWGQKTDVTLAIANIIAADAKPDASDPYGEKVWDAALARAKQLMK